MSGWVRSKSDEAKTRRLVSIYKLPTTDYGDIEALLQQVPWGQGNTVTLAAMKIGARVLNNFINRGMSVEEAVLAAENAMGGVQAADKGAATEAAKQPVAEKPNDPLQQSGASRDGFSAASKAMFSDD